MTDAYYQDQIDLIKQWIAEAKQRGDTGAEERWKDALVQLKQERARFTKAHFPRYSTGMMVSGIVFSCLGATALITGLSLSLVSRSYEQTPSYVLLGAGLVSLGVGIPIAVVGARRVPKNQSDADARPLLIVSPQGAALRVTF